MSPGNPWLLACGLCGSVPEDTTARRCATCSGPILAQRTAQMSRVVEHNAPGLYRWRHQLDLPAECDYLSLGEGNTPLVREPRLATDSAVREVLLKLDLQCPTGSFKDRAVAAATAHALRSGSRGLVCASSGNAAASAAAYGARAGLPTILLVPAATPRQKLAASGVYGATQILVPGDYSNAYELAVQVEHELGLTNVTTTYANPFGVLGLRSVAYELAADRPDQIDVVIVPTSAGPLVHGVFEGFEDLYATGQITRIPRLIAVQPQGCAPIARAFENGADHVEAWDRVDTLVSGLNDPLRGYAEDGTVTLRSIRDSHGWATTVADEEVLATQVELASHLGILAEPAAAIAVASLRPLAKQGVIGPTDTVVCLLTGSGIKVPPNTATTRITADRLADITADLRRLLADV